MSFWQGEERINVFLSYKLFSAYPLSKISKVEIDLSYPVLVISCHPSCLTLPLLYTEYINFSWHFSYGHILHSSPCSSIEIDLV